MFEDTYECPECGYVGAEYSFDPLDPDQPPLCPECEGHVELVEVDDA